MGNGFVEFEEYVGGLTEFEKHILVSKDEELFNYFRKNGSYPKYKISGVFDEDNIYNISSVKGFHIDHAETLEFPDLYFCEMRANHFALIYGYSEIGNSCRLVLILANHKGYLRGQCVKFFIGE